MTATLTPGDLTVDVVPDRRRAYLVDDDLGLDFLRDVDGRGSFSRCGDVFLAKRGGGATARHDVWIAVPDGWVDATDLFGRYVGPDGIPVLAVDRWFPGTTAAGHRYNPRARWYVQTDADLPTFDAAKQAAAHRLRQIRST